MLGQEKNNLKWLITLNATFIEIIGAAHSPARELPDKTAIELDTFLKTI